MIFILNKTLINYAGDGFIQHFSIYVYLKKFYQDILKNLFNFKTIKMIDFSIGSGFDILTTLNYYGYGDPFSLIMIFFKNETIAYNLLSIVRLYFAGLSIMYFIKVKYKNTKDIYTIICGLCYAFSGFAIYALKTHSYFINSLIFLPLILAGIEIYQESGKKKVLIISVAVSFISNFYFAYMLTLIAILYVIFKLIYSIKAKKFKEDFIINVKLAIVYLEGILLSSIVLIPVIYAFFNNARNVSDIVGYTKSLFLYNLSYYKDLFTSLVYKAESANMWSVLCLGEITFISYIFLFKNKENSKYKIVLLLIFGGLLVPLVGKVFNGFSYVTNRWSFVLAIINTIIILKYLPKIINIDKSQIKNIFIIYGIYVLITVIMILFNSTSDIKQLLYKIANISVNIALFIATIVALIIISKINKKYGEKVAEYTMLGLVTCSSIVSIITLIVPNIFNFASSDILDNKIKDEIQDNGFYRVEQNDDDTPNYSLLLYNKEYNNTYYYSLIYKNIENYYNLLGLSKMKLKHRVDGLDDRVSLLSLSSVKYYRGTPNSMIPYGFNLVSEKENYNIYENSNYLSLGYLLDTFIYREEFEKLSPIQKDQALLQTTIVEKNTKISQEIKHNDNLEYNIADFNVVQKNENDKIKLTENSIIVNDKTQSLELEFDGKENSENYLIINNPKWNSNSSEISVKIYIGDKEKRFFIRNEEDNFYFDRQYIAINLGCLKEKVNNCKITFGGIGVLSFDSLYISCSDMNLYQQNIDKLKNNTMQNVKVDINTITGNISTDKKAILQLSIPYSKGWKAFVDNKETEIFETDIMFTGIELEKGNHQIKLVYETPYLKIGILISSLTVIFLVAEYIVKKYYLKSIQK